MREINGVVYADTPDESITVSAAKALPDYMILVTFSTGETRLFDGTKLTGKSFEPIKDESVFMNLKIVHGVITWADETIDISPEFVYAESYPYNTADIITA